MVRKNSNDLEQQVHQGYYKVCQWYCLQVHVTSLRKMCQMYLSYWLKLFTHFTFPLCLDCNNLHSTAIQELFLYEVSKMWYWNLQQEITAVMFIMFWFRASTVYLKYWNNVNIWIQKDTHFIVNHLHWNTKSDSLWKMVFIQGKI
jgi:hypothetical protein